MVLVELAVGVLALLDLRADLVESARLARFLENPVAVRLALGRLAPVRVALRLLASVGVHLRWRRAWPNS